MNQADPKKGFFSKRHIWGLPLAFLVLIGLLMLPVPNGLNPQGYMLLVVLAFMLVIWVTESINYPTSSIVLIVTMTLTLGFSLEKGKLIGTSKGLTMALSGFSSTAWILVTAALFIAAAIEKSGLGKRIGMSILGLVGARSNQVRFGFILMAFILSLFIPAQAANAALMTAIAVGVIQAFNLNPKGNMAKSLLIIVAFGTGIAGMGILTSGAPPIQTAKYIADATGYKISWLEWAMYGLPFAISVAIVLYFLVTKFFPPEMDEMPGGKEAIKERLKKLGKISAQERNLLIIMVLTIALWATGDHLHKIDSSTVALLTVVAIFFPPFKIANWKDLVGTVNWGTLMLFGGAISLGTSLLSTGAAAWVAKNTIIALGIAQWPILAIVAVGSLFFAIFSLAFSARSAAVAALVPVAIGLAQALGNGVNVWGLTLILYYSIQFSVIMPVNTPMSMVAYSTDTFSVSDMMKVGIPLVISAIILATIFSATYWSWLGLVK